MFVNLYTLFLCEVIRQTIKRICERLNHLRKQRKPVAKIFSRINDILLYSLCIGLPYIHYGWFINVCVISPLCNVSAVGLFIIYVYICTAPLLIRCCVTINRIDLLPLLGN